MKRNNLIYKTMMLGILTASITSCTEKVMDDINFDKNHPADVQAKFILTDVITSTAFNVVGGPLSLYGSIYMEHEAGIYNQFYNAETRSGEPYIASTYNNQWQSIYLNLKNVKIAIDKLENDPSEKGNNVTLGIAKVLLAYEGAIATDVFGDTPYLQAGVVHPNGTPVYLQPNMDKQEDIYKNILQSLDQAISLFDGEDAGVSGPIGKNDFIYGGDAKNWKKAAYGLKARYMMRQLKRSANQSTDLNAILEYISKSFQSANEEMKFAIYDGSSQLNPLFGITASRDATGASASLVEKFITLNDPRGNYSFMQCTNPNKYTFKQITDPANVVAAPNGAPEQVQFKYSYSMPTLSGAAPTQLLSYHEIMFIKAEALTRLGRNGEALSALKSAVTAAFANLQYTIESTIENNSFSEGKPSVDLGTDVAESYFSETVEPAFNASPLRQVMLQKYLSFFGASGESLEAYNDYRRLKGMGEADFIVLANPNNVTKFPLRYPYGASDVSANLQIKAAYGDGQYVYTNPVWWAGGTR